MTEQVEPHILRKYDILQKLGKGAYGIVWKAVDKQTKQIVALKKVFDAFHNATDAQRTFREVGFLSHLGHVFAGTGRPSKYRDPIHNHQGRKQ